MTNPAITIIIVSHARPNDLERVITSLAFQSVANIEIVVVADQLLLAYTCPTIPMRYIPFQKGNIAQARNIGLDHARAPLVAFIDDDAIPDPYWCERLAEPFYTTPQLGFAGGFVRGRSGIAYQWKGIGFHADAQDFDLPIKESDPPKIFPPMPDRYIKAVGTNSMFSRKALYAIGGYDESFHYYLDDTDICKRLQDHGYQGAIVPKAQIIHNYRPSRGRNAKRVPRSLYDIGASSHHFLRKHHVPHRRAHLDTLLKQQEDRLKHFFHYGLISSPTMRRLISDLKHGIADGALRKKIEPMAPILAQDLVPIKRRELALRCAPNPPTAYDPDTIYVHEKITKTTAPARMFFERAGYWQISMGQFGTFYRSPRHIHLRNIDQVHRMISEFLSWRMRR